MAILGEISVWPRARVFPFPFALALGPRYLAAMTRLTTIDAMPASTALAVRLTSGASRQHGWSSERALMLNSAMSCDKADGFQTHGAWTA
jgi:hypothetical protein